MRFIVSHLDGAALLESVHPGFFEQAHIRALPEDGVWEEMALDLRDFNPEALTIPVPEGIRYGFYEGDLDVLRGLVGRVSDNWPPLFDGKNRVYCGFDGDRVASFCLVEDMGRFGKLKVGGPGCVGTLPEYRRQGIGLKMVQDVTAILQDEGFDLSYIHFTGVGRWYEKLGYRTTLRWNRDGVVD